MDYRQNPDEQAKTEQESDNNSQNPTTNGSPYHNNRYPYNSGNPYNNNQHPCNSGNPYDNNQYPYNNGNPYNNNQYPYNNGNPYGNNNLSHQNYPIATKGDSLANAAMVMGIIALVSTFAMTVYLPFVFGSIGIILAILSKGKARQMLNKAKTGVICCTCGLILNIGLIAGSFYMVFTNPTVMKEVNNTFENMYGVTFEEMIENIMEGEDLYGN